jgi:hypothetical protein
VHVTFSERDDGQVDATLDGDWPTFTHALQDSLDIDEPTDEGEAMALNDFLNLLAAWRLRVLASTCGEQYPDTYRRNPSVPR